MEKLVPLKEWCRMIEPYYYERGNGSLPIKLEIMLKMYLVSKWYNLSDADTEDFANEYISVRKYIGLTGAAPDETVLCRFRTLLENNGLDKKISNSLNAILEKEHIMLRAGKIIDASVDTE